MQFDYDELIQDVGLATNNHDYELAERLLVGALEIIN